MQNLPLRDRLLTVGHKQSEMLTEAQFRLLRGAVVPLFSGILVINAIQALLASAYAPAWVALAPLVSFLLFSVLRGAVWWRSRSSQPGPEESRRILLQTVVHAFFGSLVFPVALMIPPLVAAGEKEASQAALGILLTVALCGYSFQALPAAAFAVFLGSLPGILLLPVFHPGVNNIALAIGYVVVAGLALESLCKHFTTLVEGIESRERMETLRQAAERGERARGEFVANMSHEIRTPLNGVLGMAELLARTGQDPRQATYTNVIIKSGNALLATVNDMLDFARIEAGQLVLDPQPFCLFETVEDVAQLHAQDAAAKGIEIMERLDSSLPRYFTGDAGRIRQVLSCLVSNAVKFTGNGHVLVDVSGKVERGAAQISIRVEDTGPGIEAERLPGIFDRFAGEGGNRKRHEGAGLGLAIALRLVHMMGGEIGVESQPGQGSSFWINLPLDVHEVLEAPVHLPPGIQGARILVIDDNPVNRAILTEQMQGWEFEAAAVDSGALGLAFMERSHALGARVDCVILDCHMPGMSGIEVARKLRASPEGADLPIVFLSSLDQEELETTGLDPAITRWLTKPARAAALRDAVVSAISRGRESEARSRDSTDALPQTGPQGDLGSKPAGRAGPVLDILLVQENEFQQAACRQALDALGLDYRIASSGEEAIAIGREHHPRLTLVDSALPDIEWSDVATAIRRNGLLPDGTPPLVFALVTRDGPGALHGPLPGLLDGRLEKPVSPAKISSLAATWLRKHASGPARKRA